ncbi:SIMPL domain-containing protein [Dehalococcoidia bacterium]|nr:SIMPL domain-containing protein [Dehalococcoidia bacterium]
MVHKHSFWVLLAVVVTALGVACNQADSPATRPTTGIPNTPVSNTISSNDETSSARLASPVTPMALSNGQKVGIWVNGAGEVVVIPDLAVLSLGVEAKAMTVKRARDNAATAMARVIAVLEANDIDEKDIQTRFFNIQPEYRWNDKKGKQEITGYRVTNTASVDVRNLEGLGVLVDQITNAGGDLVRISNISFKKEHTTKHTTQARELAVKDAMSKAQQFADVAGVNLGKLVYITETGANIPTTRNYSAGRLEMAAADMAPPTPINPGEMNIIISIQAVFSIN